MSALQKLIDIGSDAFSSGATTTTENPREWGLVNSRMIQLREEVLNKKNGFVVFENALLVLPLRGSQVLPGLLEWNKPTGWRRYYSDVVPATTVFFALDAFAAQFGIGPEGILKFEPETGFLSKHSTSLEDWARKVLGNYDFETGWSVAKQWQAINGPLRLGYRLLGIKPFVLGGDYVPENLVAIESLLAMEKLGQLYQQVRNIPDGQSVTITGWI